MWLCYGLICWVKKDFVFKEGILNPVDIITENSHWLALDKPKGVSVHNKNEKDLVSFVKNYLDQDTAYPINRLDGGTCGVVLFAKHKEAARALQQMFEKRQVKKIYLARVQVLKNKPKEKEEGVWRWPLTNRAEGRKNPKGYWARRIPCETKWSCLQVREGEALLKIELLTGRKHQIRRHSAIYGWPIWQDPRYGPKEVGEESGVNLVAKELSFQCPLVEEPFLIRSKFLLDG